MATVTIAEISVRDDRIAPVVSMIWETLTTTNDRGAKFEWPHGADRSIHVFGVEGTGGTLIMQGSNKESPTDADTDWFPLLDTEGNAISVTSVPAGDNIGTIVRWIRPFVSAGDGSTDYDVILLARRK